MVLGLLDDGWLGVVNASRLLVLLGVEDGDDLDGVDDLELLEFEGAERKEPPPLRPALLLA